MSEFLGKVTKVSADETIEVAVMSGGFKTLTRHSRSEGMDYKVLRRGPGGKPIRRPSGLTIQFFWSDVRNGPVKPGDSVMVEMQPVARPVRKL